MKKGKAIILAQATIIALLAAGLLFQHQNRRQEGSVCYEDEMGIWTTSGTDCIPIDDIMTDAEYNSIIERIDRLNHGMPAMFYTERRKPVDVLISDLDAMLDDVALQEYDETVEKLERYIHNEGGRRQ